jgi:hypothetical protein
VKAVLIFGAAIAVVVMVGCGERNSPFQPDQYYHLMSEIQTPGWAQDVAVLNDTAYVADNWGGITVIDIRDAQNPQYLESWMSPRLVKKIAVLPINRLLVTYETEANDGMKIYGIDQKQQVGEGFDAGLRDLDLLESSGSLWVFETDVTEGFRGNYYQNEGGQWLIFDAINPLLTPLGEYRGMDLIGDSLVFACLDERGVIAIALDLDNTTNPPDSIGWVETPGAAHDVIYQDGYLFVADYFGGLVVIDAADPTNMTMVAQVVPHGADRCETVIVDGVYAVLMDRYDGLFVFDVSNPLSPFILEQIELPEPRGMAFSGGRLLVTDESRGLMIFQM